MVSNRIPLVLATTLALGCSESVAPPTAMGPGSDATPSLGAVVDRFEAPWPERFIDRQSGLSLSAGASLDELSDICAGGDFTDAAEWLVAAHPTHDAGTVYHVRIREKEQSVTVWGVAVEESICQELFLQGVQPLAVGTVHMIFRDNDFAGTSSHTDSWGERIEGTVTNPATGQRYHLEAAYHVVVLSDGTVKFVQEPSIRLTPIGG